MPNQDRKILQRMMRKKEGEVLAENYALAQNRFWRAESERQSRQTRQNLARRQMNVAEKRKKMNKDNEARLFEAKSRFLESRDRLRTLIMEKEERSARVRQTR